jgi:hypothetical protein
MDQQKKNIRLLLSLVVLIALSAMVYWFQHREVSVVDKNKFRAADLATIDQVELTTGDAVVTLTLDGARWKVNGRLADRDMIDVLFATLQQAEPKRAVSASQMDSVAHWLTRSGVQVKLMREGQVEQTFIAGGNRSKTQAYFRNPADDEIYLVAIPGYRVYASGIFELPETGWLDKYVFNFNWRNFQDLSVSFPGQEQENFEVRFIDGLFTIPSMDTDTTRLNNFLDAVSLVTVDAFMARPTPPTDSLLQTTPYVVITVRDVGSHEYRLELFPPMKGTAEILGRINGQQAAWFSLPKARELTRPRSFFRKK